MWNFIIQHSLIRVVLIQNCCAIRAKFWKFDFWLYKIDYFNNSQHRQTVVKMAQWFSIFWITPLNCGWQITQLVKYLAPVEQLCIRTPLIKLCCTMHWLEFNSFPTIQTAKIEIFESLCCLNFETILDKNQTRKKN